jgi:hypothetical protein
MSENKSIYPFDLGVSEWSTRIDHDLLASDGRHTKLEYLLEWIEKVRAHWEREPGDDDDHFDREARLLNELNQSWPKKGAE